MAQSEEVKKILIKLAILREQGWKQAFEKEKQQIPRPTARMQGKRMADMAFPSRGWLQGIPCTVTVQNANNHWKNREGEEGGRKSLLLAMKKRMEKPSWKPGNDGLPLLTC